MPVVLDLLLYILRVVTIVGAGVAVLLESKILVYTLQHPIIIRLTTFSYKVLISSALSLVGYIFLSLFIYNSEGIGALVITIGVLFTLFFIIRYFIYYDWTSDNFVHLPSVEQFYDDYLLNDQEMIVVHTNSHPLYKPSENDETNQWQDHVVPMKNLRAADMILGITPIIEDEIASELGKEKLKYSLTYCLLCNTVHAYMLPTVNSKQLPLTSLKGSIMNGNKILTDYSGKYIWQQMTGQPITPRAEEIGELVELHISRTIWKHVKERYPNALYYKAKGNPVTYLIFKTVGKLVRLIPFLRFSKGGNDKRLRKKTLVVGVHLFPHAKAYPLELFEKDFSLLEDEVKGEQLTLLHSIHGSIAFKGHGYEFLDGTQVIQKDGKRWNLNGQSLGDWDDLEILHVTDRVYWYLWSQFYPDTELYSKEALQ